MQGSFLPRVASLFLALLLVAFGVVQSVEILHPLEEAGHGPHHEHQEEVFEPPLEIGIPDEEFFRGTLPGWRLPISDYFSERNNSAEYVYDFGDEWVHALIFEEILPREAGSTYPGCLAGERSCPPEDCGGIGGYQSFLESILDPSHDEHQEMLEWAGGPFDPEQFETHKIRFDDPEERWQIAFGKV